MKSTHAFSLLLVSALSACATPQQRAIHDYCRAQAQREYPEQWTQRSVERNVHIGETTVGWKETCKTVSNTRQKDQEVVTTECTKRRLTEPVYERRTVAENWDTNAAARQATAQACRAEALKGEMFTELNTKQ